MHRFKKYLELTKPKVTLLNLLVAVTCFNLAAYPEVNWFKLAVFGNIDSMRVGVSPLPHGFLL